MREASSIEAATDARDALAAAPTRADLRNVLHAFAPFRGLPNQTARLGRGRPFTCAVGTNGVILPAVVNGKSVEWLFDSAFSHTALSESEARMLGIFAHSAAATAEDFAGGSTSMRTAIAERITIGDSEVRNVPVLVFPDSQP
ncbi:MAG TPA: retropepsin-like aspartic protease, partial [Vicinamibacterales bacterium]|nr:retropepsin-like aspartic protease [Vicinamibacterales bacterium]